jgi:pyroglutamyl-peptidase
VSRDAGRYLCNYLYWRAWHHAPSDCLIQFVHIPGVGAKPRPCRVRKPRLATWPQLLRGAEALLVALIAAKRR